MADRVIEDDLSPEERSTTSFHGDAEEIAENAVADEPAVVESPRSTEGEEDPFSLPATPEADIEEIRAHQNTATAVRDDYLDDDELWMKSSDEVLHSDGSTVVAKQDEAVVSWDIYGLYDEQGKVRSKRSLRNNPPALVISDSNGGEATFVLTKDLSGVLATHLENTHRAYYGIRPRSEMSFKEKMLDARSGLRENMGKAIIIGGILLGLVIFGIFF